jgi:hypothetical protein
LIVNDAFTVLLIVINIANCNWRCYKYLQLFTFYRSQSFRHRGQKLRAAARRKSRERRRLSAEEEEEKKIRRSLNVADPEREKTIQLMKWRRQAFIEIDHHGVVRTTNNSSSIFSKNLYLTGHFFALHTDNEIQFMRFSVSIIQRSVLIDILRIYSLITL